MFTAKFIKNIFLEAEGLRAIGRSGKLTRVFAKQGDLDGSCTIYSLMMMLIFHQKLDWEDLIDGERAKDFEFVSRIQHEFLHGLNGLCTGGFKLREIAGRVNKCEDRYSRLPAGVPGVPGAIFLRDKSIADRPRLCP